MTARSGTAAVLAAVVALAALAHRATATPEGEKGGFQALASRVQEIRLENGLRVLVLERHAAPTVAFATVVGTGSVDENTGETGLAHMFEHMAFKGSTSVGTTDWAQEKVALEKVEKCFLDFKAAKLAGKPQAELETLEKSFEAAQKAADAFVVRDEFSVILQRNGGAGLNAWTSADVTTYHVELPSNRLELWFALEADRFRNPVLREFFKEKGAVEEERRMRTESNPVGALFEEYLAGAFRAHPYGRPTIGHMSDLFALSTQTAQRFFDKFYAPNNMTIAVVGDVDAKQVEALAKKYFGPMPRGPAIDPLPTVETPQKGERRVEVEAEAQPVVILGWHIPAARHADAVALDALSDVLSTGRTSRLVKSLVSEKKVAVQVQAGIGEPGQRFPNLLIVFAVPAADKTSDDCVAAIEEELAKVKADLVTEEELAVVKTRARANFIRGLKGNMGLAQGLALRQTIQGGWRDLFEQPEKIERLTREDLRRVAAQYLTKSNRIRGEIVKPYGPELPRQENPDQPGNGQSKQEKGQ